MPFLAIQTGHVHHRVRPNAEMESFGPGSTIEITPQMVPHLSKHGPVTDHDPRLAAEKEAQAQAAFDQRQAELDRKAEELAVWEKNLKERTEVLTTVEDSLTLEREKMRARGELPPVPAPAPESAPAQVVTPAVKVVDEAKAAEERYLSQTKPGSIKGNK